jgi:hypothetical protein
LFEQGVDCLLWDESCLELVLKKEVVMNMKKAVVTFALSSVLSLNSHAGIIMDNDLFQNATVTSADAWTTAGIFDGHPGDIHPDTGEYSAGFFDANMAVSQLYFNTSSQVVIAGVRVFASHDGEHTSYHRSMSGFRLYADTNKDGFYDTKLVDQAVDYTYSVARPYNEAAYNGLLVMTFGFNENIGASNFLLEVDQGVEGVTGGVRLSELDALSASAYDVSSPRELAWLSLFMMGGLCARKKGSSVCLKSATI